MTTTQRHLPTPAFPFLADLTSRLDGRATATPDVLEAVALLTATADPRRADRLRPRPGEPAALVLRLAIWALRQVDAGTVLLAHSMLQQDSDQRVEGDVQRVPC